MSALYDALASGLGRRVDEGGAAGGVVSVLEHGKMRTRTLGAGWEDAVRGEPEAPIYSVTKTFLAVLVLRLFRETGRSLDVPAAHWHGDIPGADRFSVRQLLNHTAGVRDYGPLAEYHRAVARQPGEPWSRGEFAKHTWLRGLSGDPGERFAYANPGYRLLAEIAEAESGLALGAALERHVLEPASIGHTRVVTRVEDLAGSAPAD